MKRYGDFIQDLSDAFPAIAAEKNTLLSGGQEDRKGFFIPDIYRSFIWESERETDRSYFSERNLSVFVLSFCYQIDIIRTCDYNFVIPVSCFQKEVNYGTDVHPRDGRKMGPVNQKNTGPL